MSEEDYYTKLNNYLEDETITVHYNNDQSIKGIFTQIDDGGLVIWNYDEYLKLKTNMIDSIKYKGGPVFGGATVGAIAGLGFGSLLFYAADARVDVGGAEKNAEWFLAIPLSAIAGGILGGTMVTKPRTIYFNK